MSSPQTQTLGKRYQLGAWYFDTQSGELTAVSHQGLSSEAPSPQAPFSQEQSPQEAASACLPKQQQQLLCLLLQQPGELVTREQLIARLWPDGRVVEYDQSLNACMRKLRKALGDDSQAPVYIETLPGKGYRLIAEVSQLDPITTNEPATVSDTTAVGAQSSEEEPEEDSETLSPVPMFVILGVFLLFMVGMFWRQVTPKPEPPSLAVTPMQAQDSEVTSAWVIREELLTQLSRVPVEQLSILAPSSAVAIAEAADTGATARYWLTSSLTQDALNTRVHFRLLNEQQQQLWAQSYDWLKGAGTPVYQSIAQQVIAGITAELEVDLPELANDAQVLDPLWQESMHRAGYLLYQGDTPALLQAESLLQSVLQQYPDYPPAHLAMSQLYQQLSQLQLAAKSAHLQQSAQWAQRTLALDPNNAEAYLALAYFQLYEAWDFAAARQALDKGLSIAPNHAKGRSLNAAWYASMQRHDDAIAQARLAKRLDPLSMTVNADLCWYLNFAKRYRDALKECQAMLELAPESHWTRLGVIEAWRQQRRWGMAIKELAGLIKADIPREREEQDMQQLFAKWTQKLVPAYAEHKLDAYLIASAFAQSGNKEQTLVWLNKAYQDRNGFMIFLAIDPRFKHLKKEPEYRQLLVKVGLAKVVKS